MADFFALLLLPCLILAVLGFFKPNWTMPSSWNPKPLKAFFLYLSLSFVCVILVGALPKSNQHKQRTASEPVQSARAPLQAKARATTPVLPAQQAAFIEIAERYAKQYDKQPNELKKSAVRKARDQGWEQLLSNKGRVTKWVGQVESMGTNGEGDAYVSLRISPNISIKTWNNALSDFEHKTLISNGSDMYNAISELTEGQRVLFDATLLTEGSVTEAGSMYEPEIIARFRSVTPYK